MSFDLCLCRGAGKPSLTVQEVDQVLRGNECFQVEQEDSRNRVYHYDNPDTGVYFRLAYEQLASADQVPRTQLNFSLNYLRPTFFALEAMPIVVSVSTLLDLHIENPQDNSETAEEPGVSHLVQSWSKHNEMAVRASLPQRSGNGVDSPGGMIFCPRKPLDYWWRYMLNRVSLDEQYDSADIFVPSIFLMRPANGGEVIMAVAWPHYIPIVFPAVQGVIIGRKPEAPGQQFSEEATGVVAFRQIYDILGSQLERISDPVPHWVYSVQTPRPEVRDALDKLELIPFACFERLHPDSLIDVPM